MNRPLPAPLRPLPSRSFGPTALFARFQRWSTGREHALLSFALARILIGCGMLLQLVPSFADRHYLWGIGSTWVDTEATLQGYPVVFDLLFPKTSRWAFDLCYVVLVLLAIVFVAGWKTRYVTPFLLLFWVSLQTNSMLLTNGGDTLVRMMLFFMMFARLDARLSATALWNRARGRRAKESGTVVTTMHNTVLVICCTQILLVYLTSSIYKLMGSEWLDGSAVYYALQIDAYRVHPFFADMAWQVTDVVRLVTWVSLAAQLVYPFLFVWRPARYVTLAVITVMHLSIAVLLGLWPFSLFMIALDVLFIRDESWSRAARAVRGFTRRIAAPFRSDGLASERDLV